MKKLITSLLSMAFLVGMSSCVPVDPNYGGGYHRPGHHPGNHHGYRKVIVRGTVYYVKNGNYYKYSRGRYVAVRNPYHPNRPLPGFKPQPTQPILRPRPNPTQPILRPKPTQPILKPKPSIPFKPRPVPYTPPRLGS